MTFTPPQLDIIRLFWRKELSFGCIVEKMWNIYTMIDIDTNGDWIICRYEHDSSNHHIGIYEILWHIPHLEDVFRVAKEKEFVCIWAGQFPLSTEYFISIQKNIWESVEIDFNPTKSLINQDETTLNQLLAIFK